MIIVEGYDGAGKTTVAEKLSNRFGLMLHHAGGPPETVDDVMSCLARARGRMVRQTVQDRVTHISEGVYGMLCRPRNSALALSRVSDLGLARVLVYCRPSDGVILNNLLTHRLKTHDTQKHGEFVRDKAPELINVYDTVVEMARGHVVVLTYDYTKQPDGQLFKEVERYLQ